MNYIKKLYSGRINRKNYGLGLLFFLAALILFAAILTSVLSSGESSFSLIVMAVVYAVFIVHIFSLHVRRLHDMGKSGWKVLLFVIPLVNLITLIWLLSSRGEEDSNKYGVALAKNAKFFDVIFGRNVSVQGMPDQNNRYCHKCGSQMDGDSKFCIKCGAKVMIES